MIIDKFIDKYFRGCTVIVDRTTRYIIEIRVYRNGKNILLYIPQIGLKSYNTYIDDSTLGTILSMSNLDRRVDSIVIKDSVIGISKRILDKIKRQYMEPNSYQLITNKLSGVYVSENIQFDITISKRSNITIESTDTFTLT